MSVVSPEMRSLARWLLNREAAAGNSPAQGSRAAVRICDQFNRLLSALMGRTGYTTLLSRALALAQVEAPWLGAVRVMPDGALEGLAAVELPSGADDPTGGGEALVTHLLSLLTTFIGQPLTVKLVRDVWPDAPFDGVDGESETER